MPMYSKFLSGFVGMLFLLSACGEKKKTVSLSGDEPVNAADFIEFFPKLDLPFYYADSSLRKTKKEPDSLQISYKAFTSVIPDTVLSKIYGKGTRPKIYAVGKTFGPNKEIFLVVKTITTEKRAMLLLGFLADQSFSASLTALKPDKDATTNESFTLDRRHLITKNVLRKNRDGSMSEGRDVYAFNAESRLYYLVMTDALEDKPAELINPIDTLSRKQKWTADYSSGKMNLVSIRDGRRNNEIRFFIHFDKGGKCSGELKGEADMTGSNTAEYRQDGDPCKLKFIFSSGSVTLQEVEGCGSYRPQNCSFNGSYARKNENKPKTTGKNNKK